MDDFEKLGSWWLPAHPSHTVSGTLTFSQAKGFRLKLIGKLDTPAEDSSVAGGHPLGPASQPFPLIVGATTDGKQISLVDCHQVRSQYHSKGGGVEEYTASVAYVGIELNSLEEARFYKAQVRFSRLSDWVARFGFDARVTHHKVDNREQFEKYELTYRLPDDLRAVTAHDAISVFFTFHRKQTRLRAVELHQSTGIRIEPERELTLDELKTRFVQPLANLLTLATNRPNAITELVVYARGNYLEVPGHDDYAIPIQVIFRQVSFEAESDTPLLPQDMLFTLADVDDFQGMVECWLTASGELDSVCNLFFGVQYSPQMYVEHRFLSLVQALESYHRRRWPNDVLPKAQHKQRVEAILERTPEEYRSWLRELLNFSNEPRLAQRLSDLVAYVGPAIAPLVRDPAAFVKVVKDTRNYYTHYDKTLARKAADQLDLYWLAQTLSYLLQGCLLRELGLSLDRCAELFSRNRRYQHAIRQAQDVLLSTASTNSKLGPLDEEVERMRQFPGIAFRGPRHARRAWLEGTALDVWEVIDTFKRLGSLERMIEEGDLTEGQIRLALAYHEAYPSEVERAIAENERAQETEPGVLPLVAQA